ncbi:CvpA family protein [Ascidiimonas sp. W6]|uniref:CvpA family protein n=1 Tax=Ascidiimonas meishanensis TaxID=3128903 RepID=UPI0030EB22C1
MSFFDMILGGILLFGIIRGLLRGLFVEIAALFAVTFGIYGAIHFSYFLGDYLADIVDWKEKYINLTAFSVTFTIIVFAVAYSGKLLTKVADFASLGFLNKLLGALFGGLKLAVIAGAVLVFFDKTNNTIEFVDKETTDKSILYEPVKELGSFVFSWVLKEKRKEEDRKDENLNMDAPIAD